MLTIVLAAAIGQQCSAAARVQVRQQVQAVQSYGYAAPVQAQAQYPAAYATTYTPYVKELQFVAVEPYYHSAIAGDYIRRERAEAEASSLRQEIAELRRAMQELTAVAREPAPATPPPDGPAYPVRQPSPQSPPAPSKWGAGPTPQAPPKNGGWGQPPAPDGVQPPPEPTPDPGPVGAAAQPPADVLAVLTRSCFDCHNPAKRKGDLSLFSAPGVVASLSPETRGKVAEQVISGAMPESGPALTNQEVQAIVAWLGQ